MDTQPSPSPAPEQTRPSYDVTVVLPALNEVGHIGLEVDRITEAMEASPYSFEILVIDDGSTDGTGDVVEGRPHVRLMRFPVNRGSGTARRIGTQEAYGRYVVWTDADMTYPNERIPELIDILETGRAQQVVGARRTEEGTHKLLRVPAKWTIRKLAEYLSASEIPDLNSGLRAFRRADALPFLGLLPTGFSCVTTITLSFLSNGLVVEYMPIDYAQRAGRSHFHPIKDAYRYILQVVRMVTFFEPLRVFAPLSLFLLFLGGAKFLYDVVGGAITDGDPFALSINTVLLLVTGMLLFCIGLLADLIVRTSRYSSPPR